MAKICDHCPITTKAEYCCGSHPETGESKIFVLKPSGRRIRVCVNLQIDGTCLTYWDEETCHGYDCEKKYRQGLDSGSDFGS